MVGEWRAEIKERFAKEIQEMEKESKLPELERCN